MAGYRGKQGRKPKASTIVNRLRQDVRSRQPERERRRIPNVPSHLSPTAQAEWRRVGRILLEAGLLTNLDTTALGLYCDAYGRWLEATIVLQGPAGRCAACDPRQKRDGASSGCKGRFHTAPVYGTVIIDRLGRSAPSPYLKVANDAMLQMTRLLGEFGLTPASRSRIPKAEPARPRELPRADTPGAGPPLDPRQMFRVLEGKKR